MTERKSNFLIASLLLIGSLVYYYLLSSSIWTWVYASGDSGDWLQFTNWWITPQPFGSPFFITAIRLLGILFPAADPYRLLIFSLSVVPAAIIVALVYYIGLELTHNKLQSLAASLVLMGMSLFLSQATVFEQYMTATLFIVAAFYAYLKDKWVWAVILLGIGLANHIMAGTIAVIWLAAEWKQRKRLFKLIPLFIIFGVLPYGLIAYLMTADNPKLFAGYLSLPSLNVYFGILKTTGNLAMRGMPQRLLDVGIVLLSSLGLACYPLAVALRKDYDTRKRAIVGTIIWVGWFWFSNTFFTTFKYMAIISPLIAAYVAVGLSKLPKWHTLLVMFGAICLIVVNAVFLNADKMAHADPQVTTLYDKLMSLPDGSAVLSPRGGAYGFVLFYALSQGKDLTPLLLAKQVFKSNGEPEMDKGYIDYLLWFKRHYTLSGDDHFEMTTDALDKGIEVYMLSPDSYEGYTNYFDMADTGTFGLVRITKTHVANWDEWQEAKRS